MPRPAAKLSRAELTPCVDTHAVSFSPSHSHTVPCASMQVWVMTCVAYVCSSVCAAALKPAARSPTSCTLPARTLPFGNTPSGARPASADSTLMTAGSGSYSTFTARAASMACSSVSAATAATSSPWYRTRFVFGSLGSRMTSDVLKPGTRSAAEKSIDTTRARGYGERTARPYTICGRVTSNVYFARPLTLSGPSRRLTRVPTTVLGVDGQLYFGSTGGCCGAPPRPPPPCGGCPCGAWGVLATAHPLHTGNRLEDPRERPASADVA